jgi:dTDP-4-amino-4,6-dideoxygalactose transaminase
MTEISVPFFRAELTRAEVEAVVATLRSGWLTTGPKVRQFEGRFAEAVGARYAVAVNSATAALHLAVEALSLGRGDGVLVPTHTFAATAEVVRYMGAVPILVDADPLTLNMSLSDAAQRLDGSVDMPNAVRHLTVKGIMPVHVGGLMMDIGAIRAFAAARGCWIVEDAAHAFPAAWRQHAAGDWIRCGQGSADVTCFSFYANKTITTGEGGMAVTDDDAIANRIRLMSLHGLSRDAWDRYAGGGWDYRIIAPGYKYNLTDIAAAIGLQQLDRAEQMRQQREDIAGHFLDHLRDVEEIELPPFPADRVHAWHLFPIRLRLERLTIDRNQFIDELRKMGVGTSVHWRPLHMHPYYQDTFGWKPEQFPVATREWQRLISLPLFPTMTAAEIAHVVTTVTHLCARFAKPVVQQVLAAGESGQ